MAKSARETALSVLERCRRNQSFSDALLGSAVKSAGLDSKDSALCAKLCYGVLQNMLFCDFYIDKFTDKSNKLEPKVRDILRLSVYQILFLNKIPAHAAVSEGVELCKKCGFSRAGGLVNAVLRRIADNRDKLPEIPKKDVYEYLSVKYSTPIGLVHLLGKDFDSDFLEELLSQNNLPAPTVIQVNTLKTSASELLPLLESHGITLTAHPILSDCYEAIGTGDIAALEEHENGLFYVQDAAARLSVLASGAKSGDCVLDACSAPGGKSFATAVLMNNSGKILSCDIHENKLSRVSLGAKRLGIGIIETEVMDASEPKAEYKSAFDVVLADVPCSGLGVIRKKPDIRYKSLSELVKLPETQLNILNGLSLCVKAGGVLLYSTCTVLNNENSGVINRFLDEHSDFSLEGFTLPAPIGEVSGGKLSLYPHIHQTDGFFICKLRKKG